MLKRKLHLTAFISIFVFGSVTWCRSENPQPMMDDINADGNDRFSGFSGYARTSSSATTDNHSSLSKDDMNQGNETVRYEPLPVFFQENNQPTDFMRLFWDHETLPVKFIQYYCPRQIAVKKVNERRTKKFGPLKKADNIEVELYFALRRIQNKMETGCDAPIIILRETQPLQVYSSYGFYIYTENMDACDLQVESKVYVEFSKEYYMERNIAPNAHLQYTYNGSRKKEYHPANVCFIELYKSYDNSHDIPVYYEYTINYNAFEQFASRFPYDEDIQRQDENSPYIGCISDEIETAYDMENQRKVFQKLINRKSGSLFSSLFLNNSKLDDRFMNYFTTRILLRKVLLVHLIPEFLFAGSGNVYGNCSYVPIWNEIYLNYFFKVEKAVYTLLSANKTTVKIFKGFNDLLMRSKNKVIFMDEKQNIPIPALIWILVIDYQTKQAVFVRTINNPFQGDTESPFTDVENFCNENCTELGLNIVYDRAGMVRCCHPADTEIRKKIQLPEVIDLSEYQTFKRGNASYLINDVYVIEHS